MFFEPSSFSERTLTMDYFHEWANGIASSYLNSGAAPTDSLCKLAAQEELTPDQIQVLAAEVNKKIHAHKFASVQDKYFAADFPLADAKAAIMSLQADKGETKVATKMPEPKFSQKGPDFHEMFGVKPETMDKTASLRFEVKTAVEKAELLESMLADRRIMTKVAADKAEKDFIKQARDYLISYGDNSAARMKLLGNLDHFVKQAELPVGKKILAKVALTLGKEGKLEPTHTKKAVDYFLSKEADLKAPQELISEWLPAQIVNGNHPLYITLKTYHSTSSALELDGRRHELVKDNLKILRQKARAL